MNLGAKKVKSSISAKNVAECDACRPEQSSVRLFRGDQQLEKWNISKTFKIVWEEPEEKFKIVEK